jgi:hypothetical protein
MYVLLCYTLSLSLSLSLSHCSYPFVEDVDVEDGSCYMDKRCPAWCDRITMNESGLSVVKKVGTKEKNRYWENVYGSGRIHIERF